MKTRSDSGPMGEEKDCASVRDLLPIQVLGELAPGDDLRVESHLAACGECREEQTFVRRLVLARVEPPRELLSSILAAVDEAARPMPTVAPIRRSVTWALPAAAAIVLALGIGTIWNGPSADQSEWNLALESDVTMAWFGDEWMVAGAPMLAALPDEVLRSLIAELDR